ncbi:L-asparaginase [Duganella qianjiadongensis]|uniref:L-asparaginase n=1 Tax=Duganella qianjiadongensis TaxID=2692176 RepID=UPI001E356A39|nr:L-asparaginase [Duganella qianjiadongensis]
MTNLAPGTVIFHRHRGYGVITAVNLLTGWIAARFGSESRTLDLNLSTDEVQTADGVPILFRRAPPDRMPQARLMAVVRALHSAGYQRLYLYVWPKASGLHWRWHLFTGRRDWLQRSWREGWYGSGADYNVNPVMGWGDKPGASTEELIEALARFDPHGLAQALGRDEDHTAWFAAICAALLPGYMYSLDMARPAHGPLTEMPPLPVVPVRASLPPYAGPALPWPPGWQGLWSKVHALPPARLELGPMAAPLPPAAGAPSDADEEPDAEQAPAAE